MTNSQRIQVLNDLIFNEKDFNKRVSPKYFSNNFLYIIYTLYNIFLYRNYQFANPKSSKNEAYLMAVDNSIFSAWTFLWVRSNQV